MDGPLQILNPGGGKIRKLTDPVRVVGIDLGTTNSTVAEIVWHSERPQEMPVRCLEIDQETTAGVYTHFLVPSAVAIYQGREWVGEGAKRLQGKTSEAGLELTRNLFLECKNDIGALRTYHKAPEGYRSAAEVGGRVLSFLKSAAEAQDATAITKFVVTVPASFQASQRADTVKAAHLAGLELGAGDLLDEPVAAFLDYLLSQGEKLKGLLDKPKTLLVFDFGGGTCDVAIFKVGPSAGRAVMDISPLAVSRYHRLGGGDIDRAIVHEVLLPQLIEQNALDPLSLSFDDKKQRIEPALIGVAEALKTGLCQEFTRRSAFGQGAAAGAEPLVKRQPGAHPCVIGDQQLTLQSPSLSAEQFEEVLKPFLDRDLLYARESEYRLTASIFGPLEDALDRGGTQAKDIDLCLLVGGSSLIPQVRQAVAEYLSNATVLGSADPEPIQAAIARGAAYHALARTLFGRGVFELVTPDRLSVRTSSGAVELVPRNSRLPYPKSADGPRGVDLAVPETSAGERLPLRVEILAGEPGQERPLFTGVWHIPAFVNRGEKLRLDYQLDENQVLTFSLALVDQADVPPFEGTLENPLTNVVNPHQTRLKIQKVEEELRTGKVPADQRPDTVVQLAKDYAEIQQTEKAISYLRQALRLKNQSDPWILNLLGVYLQERGDFKASDKCYRESAASGGGTAPLFNLTLSLIRQRQFVEADTELKILREERSDGPTLTLAAQVADGLNDSKKRDALLIEALGEFGPVLSIEEWELGWLITAARMAGHADRRDEAMAEQRRRKSEKRQLVPPGGKLPDVAGGLLKV